MEENRRIEICSDLLKGITSRRIWLTDANITVIMLYTMDIASINIQHSFIGLEPDWVEVRFRDGRVAQFNNYNGELYIKGEKSPMSLSRVNSVTFGRMN